MADRSLGDAVDLYRSFLRALLRGGRVNVPIINTNKAGAVQVPAWDPVSVQLLIEEGRRQIDSQTERYARLIERGQALVTASLVLLAFIGATTREAGRASGVLGFAAQLTWAVGLCVGLLGALGATAVIVARADFEVIDATQVSTWTPPIASTLAEDYAKSVILGEDHLAARTLMLRSSTRVVVSSALLIAWSRVFAGL